MPASYVKVNPIKNPGSLIAVSHWLNLPLQLSTLNEGA